MFYININNMCIHVYNMICVICYITYAISHTCLPKRNTLTITFKNII